MQNAEWKNKVGFIGLIIISLLIGAGFLTGCAHKGPILADFQYQSAATNPEAESNVIVGLSPFKDERGGVNSVIGKRFVELNDVTNDIVVQGTVADKATAAMKKALTDRGIQEKAFPSWDLTEAGIPSDGAKLLISGEIKKFWVDSKSSLANTVAKANVELRISIADIEKKKIVRVLNVSSSIERQNITYTGPFMQSVLSEALSRAIDQIFSDEEFKNRLL